jgi:dihydrodipicolinate synthase/N-acetylneuraminate lyase
MTSITILSFNCTTFSTTKELDAQALRKSLQRFIDSGIVVFLASGGSGEGNSLSRDELRDVYRIGVEVCAGKQPVNANLPEVGSAQHAIELAQLAIEAGVDAVNLYGPASLHGYRPTDAELTAYYDEMLAAIKHPVVIAPNPVHGYTPTPAVIADICNRHDQVVAVNLIGLSGDAYFLELRAAIKRDVAFNVPLPGSLNMFALGASGVISPLANIIPKTIRRYVDLYESGDLDGSSRAYEEIGRFNRYVENRGGPRWQKMAMKVLKLPGGEGGLRAPYLMPQDDEVQHFADGLLQLGLPEVNDMAQEAGLSPTDLRRGAR